MPDALCDAMAGVLPIKNANGFKDALPLLSASDSLAQLCSKLRQQTLGFLSYQDPKKVIAGYALIGQGGDF